MALYEQLDNSCVKIRDINQSCSADIREACKTTYKLHIKPLWCPVHKLRDNQHVWRVLQNACLLYALPIAASKTQW